MKKFGGCLPPNIWHGSPPCSSYVLPSLWPEFSGCRSSYVGGCFSPELLRDGCQRSYLVQRNTSQVGAWVLRYIHSYSISCLPILEQNLRLYQKNQEVTFITIPSDPYPSPVRTAFAHLGSSTIFQTAAPLQWKQLFISLYSQNCLALWDISAVDYSKHDHMNIHLLVIHLQLF